MRESPARTISVPPSEDPILQRTLEAAGLPRTGRFRRASGWVSRAWVGDEVAVRVSVDERHRDAYRHEARVVGLLEASDVPYARHIASGEGPDGPWYVSERLPGRTLHEVWPDADPSTRRTMIESLAEALRALHQVPVPVDLLPPWLEQALAGGPWPAFHPPVVSGALRQVEAARRRRDHDPALLAEIAVWIRERLPLFADDHPAIVHGDVHGANVMVDRGQVSGLIDFAEALAQPADAELDTILRWCARPQDFPPTPGSSGLAETSLAEVPGWLRGSYPELFASAHLGERLALYDTTVELAILAHHGDPAARETARRRIAHRLDGREHRDAMER